MKIYLSALFLSSMSMLLFVNNTYSQNTKIMINPQNQLLYNGELFSDEEFITVCWNAIFKFQKYYEDEISLEDHLKQVNNQNNFIEIVLVYTDEHEAEFLDLFIGNLSFTIDKMKEYVFEYLKKDMPIHELEGAFSYKIKLELYVAPPEMDIPPPPPILYEEPDLSSLESEDIPERKELLSQKDFNEVHIGEYLEFNYPPESVEFFLFKNSFKRN